MLIGIKDKEETAPLEKLKNDKEVKFFRMFVVDINCPRKLSYIEVDFEIITRSLAIIQSSNSYFQFT